MDLTYINACECHSTCECDTLVLASQRAINQLDFISDDDRITILPVNEALDLLEFLELHNQLFDKKPTLVLVGNCRDYVLQIGSASLTLGSLLKNNSRWRALLVGRVAKIDIFVTAGSLNPELLHCLALTSDAEVGLIEPQPPSNMPVNAASRIVLFRRPCG